MAAETCADKGAVPPVAAIATASRDTERADSVAVDFLELLITVVNAGTARAARMPRTTMATTSSNRVNARRVLLIILVLLEAGCGGVYDTVRYI